MSGSAIYVGSVGHRRMGGPVHAFSHRVWYMLIDLDELPELANHTRFFSHNRFNLTSFDDRDHMGPQAEPVRYKLEAWLERQGHILNPVGHKIQPKELHC